ncbi:MAG: glycosyltransferase family 2 protein [Acidobacteriota bacterium]
MTERIVVAIPALNAEATIGGIVRACLQHLPDVIVIDDGSSDGTGVEAREAGADVIRHPRNRGKGAALKTAFQLALDRGFDAVVTLDADGQHLADEIPKFVALWKETGAHLIIGSRRHLFDQMVRRRRGANLFSAWTISIASGTRISDSQSGYRLYSSDLLRKTHILANGFDAESEVIVRAGRDGSAIISMPIGLGFVDGVQTSHYRPLSDTLRIAWRVMRTRLRR